MSRPLALLLVGLLVVAASLCISFVGPTADTRVMAAPPDGTGMTLYDPDPKHLWNRLTPDRRAQCGHCSSSVTAGVGPSNGEVTW